jgi:hypothetical protein
MRIGNFACIRLVRQHGGLSNAERSAGLPPSQGYALSQ